MRNLNKNLNEGNDFGFVTFSTKVDDGIFSNINRKMNQIKCSPLIPCIINIIKCLFHFSCPMAIKLISRGINQNHFGYSNLHSYLDENTINEYQKLFLKYFLKSLKSRLTDYSSQKFEVIEAEQKSAKYTIVKSKIVESAKSPEIKVDWRVYTKNPDKPLIRDLIVEGLSLARTQKEEFSSILNSNNNDINILISKLEEFINS